MVSRAAPSSGDQGVCAAVALGWQVAQLFHSPVHEGSAGDPRLVEHGRLPGRSRFSGPSQSRWLGEQIRSQTTTLLDGPPQMVLDALAKVQTALADPRRSPDVTLEGIFTLHCRLLEALTVADFRLGKAYDLGRAIAETALLPAEEATDRGAEQQFRCVLDGGRLITIRNWLADLKTLLPDHTAYAVSRSLHDWQQWADWPHTDGDWAAAQPAIRVQGRFWRQLLTGEKAARDILKLSDYHAAGRRVARRVITRFWWVIATATLLIAGIIFAGSYLHNIPPSIRLIGDIAWLAGALGISLKGTGALLGIGLKDVEGWLWQIELDGSVAVAATYLPDNAKPSRVSGGSLGELSPAPRTGTPEQESGVGHQITKESVGR